VTDWTSLLPSTVRAVVVAIREGRRPGRDLRTEADGYDHRVDAARKALTVAERKYGSHDQRTSKARAALEAAVADTAALDRAWSTPNDERSG
jgi:hypothetical protein